jgi:hypothetical protein
MKRSSIVAEKINDEAGEIMLILIIWSVERPSYPA